MLEDLTPDVVERITTALERGDKIEAIKIYRVATGQGLKESKDFIDALVPQLKIQDPQRFAKLSESKAGCGSSVLVALVSLSVMAGIVAIALAMVVQ